MTRVNIVGRFKVRSEGRQEIIYNEITQAGIFRILDLIGGLSSQPWDSIRLISSDPNIFVQRRATITRQGAVLSSRALFPAPELIFETVAIAMYAGGVKVAEAPAALQAGLTYYVTREDTLVGA